VIPGASTSSEFVAIVWDSSLSQMPRSDSDRNMYFTLLRNLFASYKCEAIIVYLLSSRLSWAYDGEIGKSPITIVDSNFTDGVLNFLRGVIYDGGTDFECMKDSELVGWDRVFMFTNGVNTMGKPLEALNVPMHIFSRY